MLYRYIVHPKRVRQARRPPPRPHAKRHDAAVWRAFTGAQLLLGLPVKPRTQQQAAVMVASTVQYVAAAAAILQAEDSALVKDVMAGRIPLLAAATRVAKRAKLVVAVKAASDADLASAARTIGVDRVWDKLIAPNV